MISRIFDTYPNKFFCAFVTILGCVVKPLGNRMFRLSKVLFATLLTATLGAPVTQVYAQSTAQALQELFRSSISGGGLGSGGARPSPSRAGDPAQLTSAVPQQVERICKFEEDEPPQELRSMERVGSANVLLGRDAFGNQTQQNNQQHSVNGQMSDMQRAVRYYKPNSFEKYVKSTTGLELCRFGFQTAFGGSAFFEPPPLALVPEDYVLGPGDEVFIRVWGSLEQDYAAVIDRAGTIVVPKIGPVKLAGVRYGQAGSVLRTAVRKMFSDFDVAITMGQLRGIRVYITGFAERPGAVTVSNFSSLSSVVFASGGPSSAGSFRNIELKRRGETVARFDLYDLLLKGDKTFDRPLVSEDVIHFGPIGAQVAVMGGVNKPAVFELKGTETVSDLIKMAGNLSPGSSINGINRLSINARERGFSPVKPDQLLSAQLTDGDIVKVSDTSQVMVSNDRMLKRVLVQGQVNKPGEYYLPANVTLNQAIDAAGGKAPGAFIYGLKLTRKSVLEEQKVLTRRILRELDRELVSQTAIRPNSREEAEALTARLELGRTMLARLQSFEPEGRIALPVAPGSRELPQVRLEDGDTITVPAMPNSIGVFGSVVSAGTFLYDPGKTVKDYLKLAGGASKGADQGQIFVIEANGQSRREDSGFLSWRSGLMSAGVNPGDAIVVPENMDKTTFTRELVQLTQILYQLGLGAAGIKVLTD